MGILSISWVLFISFALRVDCMVYVVCERVSM
jgi:hypothetical protein